VRQLPSYQLTDRETDSVPPAPRTGARHRPPPVAPRSVSSRYIGYRQCPKLGRANAGAECRFPSAFRACAKIGHNNYDGQRDRSRESSIETGPRPVVLRRFEQMRAIERLRQWQKGAKATNRL